MARPASLTRSRAVPGTSTCWRAPAVSLGTPRRRRRRLPAFVARLVAAPHEEWREAGQADEAEPAPVEPVVRHVLSGRRPCPTGSCTGTCALGERSEGAPQGQDPSQYHSHQCPTHCVILSPHRLSVSTERGSTGTLRATVSPSVAPRGVAPCFAPTPARRPGVTPPGLPVERPRPGSVDRRRRQPAGGTPAQRSQPTSPPPTILWPPVAALASPCTPCATASPCWGQTGPSRPVRRPGASQRGGSCTA
jgi:hypothetical protein